MKNSNNIMVNMTIYEKASLCSGQNAWETQEIQEHNIPSIMLTDGPHGLRKQVEGENGLSKSVPTTCFPPAVTTASSWNRELLREIGLAIGEECLQEGVSVLLGPGVNIKRSPLCGRNFEYFSEDPYLTGELAARFIQGVQSNGVSACIKHFAGNNQEHRRMTIDSVIDQRALREIYLCAFETAIRQSNPWTVMCAYNKLNGTYCSENSWLLNDVLREEWGFKGVVLTDWGACNDRVKGLLSGQDLEMPSTNGLNDQQIINAIHNRTLDISTLDKTVSRTLNLIQKTTVKNSAYEYNVKSHHDLAINAAKESIVLLKNDNILPLRADDNIGLIGAFAKYPRYQGSGSSLIHPSQLDTSYSAFIDNKVNISYAPGYDPTINEPIEELIEEACNIAKQSDVVIVYVGLTELSELETVDRKDLSLPESHNTLIEKLSEITSNIIVVLSNGSPVTMPWMHSVKGIVEGYLGGQGGGSAMVDILIGKNNPSGKLAETFPCNVKDTPSYNYFPSGPKTVEYRESIYVGYRYYDTAQKPVLFPFGYGLSYTTFSYSNLRVNQKHIADNKKVLVQVDIKNTGNMYGGEIVQLYIHDKESTIFRPKKELKGFEKIFLAPGEEGCVEFTLDKRAFAFYNTCIDDWYVESGEFQILIGCSSADIKLHDTIFVESSNPNAPINNLRKESPEYYSLSDDKLIISDDSFNSLIDFHLFDKYSMEKYNINSTLGDIRCTYEGKKLYNMILNEIKSNVGADDSPCLNLMATRLADNLPLRNIVSMTNGNITFDMIKAFLLLINFEDE